MEDLLGQLAKEASASKHPSIQKDSLHAKSVLESQANLLQCPPSELRYKCLKTFQDALATKNSRLIGLSISGFNKLLRDNQFYAHDPGESMVEENFLANQVIAALSSLPNHSEDIQLELLKIILGMSCIPNISLSGHLVVKITEVCGLAYGRGNASLKSASLSASAQTIAAFINHLKNEAQTQGASGCQSKSCSKPLDHVSDGIYDFTAPLYDELVPLINYFSEKFTEAHKQREDKKALDIPTLYLLECSNTLLVNILTFLDIYDKSRKDGEDVFSPYCSTLFISSLWQRLCPALIALLGTPVSTRVARGKGRSHGQLGRGSATSCNPKFLFSTQEAKGIYSVACNLVVAIGPVGEMRPVLESLFHRMLLYPPPSCRQDALRAVTDLLSSPLKLLKLAGPILYPDPRNLYQCDLALFRIILDSLMECCNCIDSSMQMTIIDCISGLLFSLEVICKGKVLPLSLIKIINEMYSKLESGDYSGPLTYESHRNFSKFEYNQNVSSDESDSDEGSCSESHSGCANLENPKERAKQAEKRKPFSDSDSSGDTEGPEDTFEENQECAIERKKLEEEEDNRLQKLSQNLSSSSTNLRTGNNIELESEKINARHFTSTLCSLLPSLLTIRSTIEVDQAIQEFSSKYCQGVFDQSGDMESARIIINADGIYLATYYALSLNLKLIKSKFYCQPDSISPLTQERFIECVFARGVLVYLSPVWVGEVYNQVLKDSLLQRGGHNPHSPYNCALINLLTDLDGLGSIEQGSQMISDFRRLTRASLNPFPTDSIIASQKLGRRIVTCSWESVISILGSALCFLEENDQLLPPLKLLLLGENSRKEEARKAQDMLVLCLNALQSTARLANILGLQRRCGVVFSLLSSACLPKDERNPLTSLSKINKPASFIKKPLKLHRAHILSFNVMMSSGLELGSHTSDCWSHLFRCCIYLAELERRFFSDNQSSVHSLVNHLTGGQSGSRQDFRHEVSSDFISEDKIISLPKQNVSESIDMAVEDLLLEYDDEINSNGFLTPHLSGRALCTLTLLVDRFFDDAANQLNLAALESFLKALCATSQSQLFSRSCNRAPKKKLFVWPKINTRMLSKEDSELIEDSLLLHRLGEVMLKIVRSGRPLIHVMKVWAIAGPHFLEAACHKDGIVSKKAISCIHDTVNALLGNQVELPHFHFNEALFKPFENLLCLELCDIEVQDQIVSSICEFIESCNSEIRSGWRPLFGALRCIRVPHISPFEDISTARELYHEALGHLRVVRDVFEAFLETDNILVFANAALDCILCLLKHVKGTEEEATSETVVCWGELVGGDLCLDALRYLHRCAAILASMFLMPSCPVFHSVQRISLDFLPNIVDCHIPGIREENLWLLVEEILGSDHEKISYSCLWPEQSHLYGKSLIQMDGGSGLLQIWYILLEGLMGAALTCARRHQPQVVDTLFGLMRTLPDCPGAHFGMYCVNHLLFPFMQEWLRKQSSSQGTKCESASSFKQYVGLSCELVVEYLRRSHKEGILVSDCINRLMLQQCLIVLVECVSYPSEGIARLGCSCLRHIAISCGDFLPPSLWDIITCSIHRASQVSLYPAYQLMHLFCPDSPSFYGDIGHVKVAARRDCTGYESDRLRQLSHQVFLLESQRSHLTSMTDNPESEDRSFIFLLYPESKGNKSSFWKSDEEKSSDHLRVPFRSLVVGLLANQMILQTLGLLLVQGSPHIVPSLANILLQASDFTCSYSRESVNEVSETPPGMLKHMQPSQILILLDSLDLTFNACVHFDKRPGLKFLVQKVAQSDKAANLYKQAGASWTLKMLTLFDLTLSNVKSTGLDLNNIKSILDGESKKKNSISCEPGKGKTRQIPESTSKRPTKLFGKEISSYIALLRDSFNNLCETYLDLVENQIDKPSIVDQMNDKPLFFLTIPMDDFPSEYRKSVDSWTRSLEDFNKEYLKPRFGETHSKSQAEEEEDDDDGVLDVSSSTSLPAKMTLAAAQIPFEDCQEVVNTATMKDESEYKEETPDNLENEKGDIMESSKDCTSDEEESYTNKDLEKKPFSFADLAHQYSSDSEEDNDSMETKGDSGLGSCSGVDQTVYKIATEKDINQLMSNYRRKKNQHSLPSQRRERRQNPFLDHTQQEFVSRKASESVTPEVEKEREGSLMKDSEAHLKVWTEMIISVFDLLSQLKDNELRPILPVVFPTMRSLTAHAHDTQLRQIVAEMFTRVACLYGFSPAE